MATAPLLAVLTHTGQLAALKASNSGPRVNITKFQIGSVSGFQPDPSETTVRGLVYSGTSSALSYQVLSVNQVRFRITLDGGVGNFTVGNIGLLDDSNNLFALAALVGQTQKIANSLPATVGNTKIFDLVINYTNVSTLLTFTVSQILYTDPPEVTDETALPAVNVAPSKFYLIQNYNSFGYPALAYAVSGSWNIQPIRPIDTKLPAYLVANLPALTASDNGTLAVASNGRKSGESASNGTGCPVWWDGTNWRTFYDNSIVAA